MKKLVVLSFTALAFFGFASATDSRNTNQYTNQSDQSICSSKGGYYDTTDNSCTIGRVKTCTNGICNITTYGTVIDVSYWRNYYNQQYNNQQYNNQQNQRQIDENNRIRQECANRGGTIQTSSTSSDLVCVIPQPVVTPYYNYNNQNRTRYYSDSDSNDSRSYSRPMYHHRRYR